jgi:hypothetical protein
MSLRSPVARFVAASAIFGLAVLATLAYPEGALRPRPASAATITVDSDDDAFISVDDGLCTFREAIINANNDSQVRVDCDPGTGADAIDFAGGITLITLSAALPIITDADVLTVEGDGDVTINGQDLYRPFDVNGGAALVLDDLIVTNGGTTASGGAIRNEGNVSLMNSQVTSSVAEHGGGIHNEGILTLTNSSVTGNSATEDGAGIHNVNGDVTVVGSHIDANVGSSNGGGIFTDAGGISLTNSTVDGNTAGFGGAIVNFLGEGSTITLINSSVTGNTGTINGGGIDDVAGDAVIVITGSSISGNETGGDGGGLLLAGGDATVTGSTIDNNEAGVSGGGIYLGGSVHLSLANSTISENAAADGGGVHVANSGSVSMTNVTLARSKSSQGALSHASTGDVTLTNTIVADQISGDDCSGNAITSAGNNLDEDESCNLTAPGDIPNGDAGLGPLMDNGGPTHTRALQPNSDAIDAGDDSDCVVPPVDAVDQRGVTRLHGTHCDIGAFEFESGTPTPNVTDTPTPSPMTSTPEPSETTSPSGTPAVEQTEIWGDNDCSGVITVADAIRDFLAILFPEDVEPITGCPEMGSTINAEEPPAAVALPQGGGPLIWGDVHCTESIEETDALAVLYYLAGLPDLGHSGFCPDVGTAVTFTQ